MKCKEIIIDPTTENIIVLIIKTFWFPFIEYIIAIYVISNNSKNIFLDFDILFSLSNRNH